MDQAERFQERKKVVTDLDAIIQSPGFVRLHGKEHKINPIEVGEFFAFANAIANIKSIEVKDKITFDELIDSYYQLIFPVCPSITKEDIKKCTQSQIAALMSMIQSHVTGGLTDEKKKNLKLPQVVN